VLGLLLPNRVLPEEDSEGRDLRYNEGYVVSTDLAGRVADHLDAWLLEHPEEEAVGEVDRGRLVDFVRFLRECGRGFSVD